MSEIKYITRAPHLDKPIEAKDILGLGDAVATVAQPVAKVIDAVFHTNVQGCGGCKKRQEALNNLVPNINPFTHG